MTIATWNIERPTKTSKRVSKILDCLKEINPDILILTETNEAVDLGNEYYTFHTTIPVEPFYKEGERRTSIYSKYKSIEQFETFRNDTSICITLRTPFGDLAVYGTVIGINGNRRKNFIADLDKQLSDFDRIGTNRNFCIAGDLNISFGDNYYYTEEGRNKLNASFDKLNLINLTKEIPDNIDHIILPKAFTEGRKIEYKIWNTPVNQKLSDHIGVALILT